MQKRCDSDGNTVGQIRRLVDVVVVVGMLLGVAGTAWATNWIPLLKSGSAGEARATGAPAAPTGAIAACTSASAKTIKVSWSSVTHATTYTVYEATTSASGTYTSVASGVTTTSWTSGTLAAANYWFEVAAYIGTNWLGTKSSATGESTISSSGCVQP
jgi:cellulose 1,4-beta-cellobiosidase